MSREKPDVGTDELLDRFNRGIPAKLSGDTEKQNLLPGRRILLDDLETNFQRIADAEISSLSALKKALSSPEKLSKFAERTHISKEYLIILKERSAVLSRNRSRSLIFRDWTEKPFRYYRNTGSKHRKMSTARFETK